MNFMARSGAPFGPLRGLRKSGASGRTSAQLVPCQVMLRGALRDDGNGARHATANLQEPGRWAHALADPAFGEHVSQCYGGISDPRRDEGVAAAVDPPDEAYEETLLGPSEWM